MALEKVTIGSFVDPNYPDDENLLEAEASVRIRGKDVGYVMRVKRVYADDTEAIIYYYAMVDGGDCDDDSGYTKRYTVKKYGSAAAAGNACRKEARRLAREF
jgi:hypothetical protein